MIIQTVVEVHGVTLDEMRQRTKQHRIRAARMALIYLLRNLTSKTWEEIGEILDRDGAHVQNMVLRLRLPILLQNEPTYRYKYLYERLASPRKPAEAKRYPREDYGASPVSYAVTFRRMGEEGTARLRAAFERYHPHLVS